jgi:hypothetical protein
MSDFNVINSLITANVLSISASKKAIFNASSIQDIPVDHIIDVASALNSVLVYNGSSWEYKQYDDSMGTANNLILYLDATAVNKIVPIDPSLFIPINGTLMKLPDTSTKQIVNISQITETPVNICNFISDPGLLDYKIVKSGNWNFMLYAYRTNYDENYEMRYYAVINEVAQDGITFIKNLATGTSTDLGNTIIGNTLTHYQYDLFVPLNTLQSTNSRIQVKLYAYSTNGVNDLYMEFRYLSLSKIITTFDISLVGPTGPTGPTGPIGPTGPSNLIYTDSWFDTYMINAPPAVTFDTPVTTPSKIYISWTYPSQINTGAFEKWLPTINTLNSDMLTNSQNIGLLPNDLDIILNGQTGYIDYHDGINLPINKIVLVRGATGTSGLGSTLFPPTYSTLEPAYIYYNPYFSNMGETGTVNVWYENNNTGINNSSVIVSKFTDTGPPSSPTGLNIVNMTESTCTFTYSTPIDVDTTDSSPSSLTISRYEISIVSSESTLRYNYGLPAIYDNRNFGFTPPYITGLSYGLTTLYPDTGYNFKVRAINSGDINNIGPYEEIQSITNGLTPSNGLTLTFPTNRYISANSVGGTNIYKVSDGNTLTNPITNLTTDSTSWSSNNISCLIHNFSNRGSTNDNIMTLYATYNNTTPEPVSLSFNGFSKTQPSTTATSTYLNITPSSTSDFYVGGAVQNTGFYLNCINNITINPSLFTPSNLIKTVSIRQYRPSTTPSGSTGNNDITIPFQFYYDTAISINPSFVSNTFNLNTVNTAQISGINIIYGTPTFNYTCSVNNMGNYFYPSPYMTSSLKINGTTTVATINETLLSKMNDGVFEAGVSTTFSNPVNITSSITSGSLSSTFSKNISLSMVARNIYGSIEYTPNPSINLIIDGPSYSLITNTTSNPTSIQTLYNDNQFRTGFRIWSSPNVPLGNTNRYGTSGNTVPYSISTYNHTWDISTSDYNNELQIFSGKYRTKGTSINGYLNYTSYSYNTYNYSTITTSGYRYATYVWQINPDNQSVTYNKLEFKIVNISPTPYITSPDYRTYIDGNLIQLYYRLENSTSIDPTGGTKQSTVWIDGNSSTDLLSNANFRIDPSPTTLRGGYYTNNLYGSSDTTFNVLIPPTKIESGDNVRVYLRFGLPMNVNTEFSYIQARLSVVN